MAWQTPRHICGHDGERYQAYGKSWQREKKLKQIESYPCPACRKAEADKQATEIGLPLLQGSPKQVAWAADIREKALMYHAREHVIFQCADASWWIDNREVGLPPKQAKKFAENKIDEELYLQKIMRDY